MVILRWTNSYRCVSTSTEEASTLVSVVSCVFSAARTSLIYIHMTASTRVSSYRYMYPHTLYTYIHRLCSTFKVLHALYNVFSLYEVHAICIYTAAAVLRAAPSVAQLYLPSSLWIELLHQQRTRLCLLRCLSTSHGEECLLSHPRETDNAFLCFHWCGVRRLPHLQEKGI